MKRLILLIILVFFCLMLVGCSWFSTTTTINTNQYYQTDYNYFCLDGDKTWSQIVVCLKAEDDAEKAQNKITNELLDQK
ncbi:MAG: hypothetical protein J5691_01505 [Bacilli bacterium]|nr:hypothetical protein [Bacilli bacterium]